MNRRTPKKFPHLIHERGISPEETDQLRQMLDQWETESNQRGGDSNGAD